MKKEKIDKEDTLSPVKGSSGAIEWVEIFLVSSALKTLKRKPPTSQQVGFRSRAVIAENDVIIFLDVLVEKRSPFDEERTCKLIFTMAGIFNIDKSLCDEKYYDFIKQYSVLSLVPYAREYANDQLRRAGNKDNDAYLPVLNAKVIANALIKGRDFTDAFV